jgi:hypothetical protein
MQNELTGSEKKLVRELINKGQQQEYQMAIKGLNRVIDEWKEKKMDNRDAYLKLYKTLEEHNKHIAQRYNGMKGSMYLFAIASLLADELINTDDMNGFSEQNQAYLNRTVLLIKNSSDEGNFKQMIVNGKTYMVKVEYTNISDEEAQRKREAITKMVLDSIMKVRNLSGLFSVIR